MFFLSFFQTVSCLFLIYSKMRISVMLLERPEKFSYEIFLSSRRGEGCHSMFYSRASIRADTYLLLLVCIAQWRPQKVYRSKSSVLLVELQMKHNSWTDRKQIAQFFYCCVFRSKEYNYSVGVVLWFAVLKQGVCKENKHTFFFLQHWVTWILRCQCIVCKRCNAQFYSACVTDTQPAINQTPLQIFLNL